MRRKAKILVFLLFIASLTYAAGIKEIPMIDEVMITEPVSITAPTEVSTVHALPVEQKTVTPVIKEEKIIPVEAPAKPKVEAPKKVEKAIKKEVKSVKKEVKTVKKVVKKEVKKVEKKVEKPKPKAKAKPKVVAKKQSRGNHKVYYNPKSKIEQQFRAALVADRKGNIYYSKNIDKKYPMASVTKVMTLLVAFDAIRSGQAHYDDKIVITKDVYRKGGSGIPMKVGETFTLIDLMRATAIKSANNAAYTIAKHIGKGSVRRFVGMMNRKAREIGVSKQISYHSPAGLPSRYTKVKMDVGTARGIYKLSRYAMKYPEYLKIAGIENMKIHNNRIYLRNRNHLLGKEGIYGIKTGYHKEAKFNITIVSGKGKEELFVVVLGGDTYRKRDAAVLYLLDKVRN